MLAMPDAGHVEAVSAVSGPLPVGGSCMLVMVIKRGGGAAAGGLCSLLCPRLLCGGLLARCSQKFLDAMPQVPCTHMCTTRVESSPATSPVATVVSWAAVGCVV
jgi:hypothetical protein